MRRLGLMISGSLPGGVAAIGWCLLDDKPLNGRVSRGEHPTQKRPSETALALARSKGVNRVSLTTYANAAAFHGSRGQREGLSLDEHRLLIAETATLLRANEIAVDFEEKS